VIAEIHQEMIHAEELHNKFMADPMNKDLFTFLMTSSEDSQAEM
jgi:hypothetical protein